MAIQFQEYSRGKRGAKSGRGTRAVAPPVNHERDACHTSELLFAEISLARIVIGNCPLESDRLCQIQFRIPPALSRTNGLDRMPVRPSSPQTDSMEFAFESVVSLHTIRANHCR